MRWVGAFIGAVLLLAVGGACVQYATSFFLDPMWNAPLPEEQEAP